MQTLRASVTRRADKTLPENQTLSRSRLPEQPMPTVQQELHTFLDEPFVEFEQLFEQHEPKLAHQEFGEVTYVGHGIARVNGIPGVQLDELVIFADGLQGMVFNLDEDEVGVILLGKSRDLHAGSQVYRTGRVIDVPVGQALLGRVVDAMGHPIDDLGPVRTSSRRAIEQPAPAIMERSPVTEPLQTGCKVIDALLPIGRGQRELILGDRQIGKTAIALDTIINQADKDVLCIYCVVGQRNAQVARFIADLRMHDALAYTVVVVASGEDAPGCSSSPPMPPRPWPSTSCCAAAMS
jgi:F-type H+-transporting ATPase subunit alpha